LLSRKFDLAAFWGHILQPLAGHLPAGELRQTYETARQGGFGAFDLKRLFAALDTLSWRIVVMLDEFDALLNHPVLNSAEFYGSLRSLSSRHASLTLIIATRRSLNQLNLQTQEINPHSSPYFNIFTELQLGPLPKRDVALLLDKAQNRFDDRDRYFVLSASGRHPYLLQLAADILFEVDLEGRAGVERYRLAAEELRAQSEGHFADAWRSYSSAERIVIMSIALVQMSAEAGESQFELSRFIHNVDDYSPELRGLEKAGTILSTVRSNHAIGQQALLWWLADEIKRAVRDETTYESWLEAQEFEGLLTQAEKKTLGQGIRKVAGLLGRGATSLTEAFAKGVGEGLGQFALRR
jgi:hypothetical protein